MCDTIVATPEATADGLMYFGKNSDREPNEAHYLEINPAADFDVGQVVQMTYIKIPQSVHTFGTLLAKPFWIWGAEMGVNEHGVAIGNEAVFTKVPASKEPGLIGMDLLRLGLERASTAIEAVQIMSELLEIHGQGGNCGFHHRLFYQNSFLIADPHEAWLFETAGKHWAAKRVKGVYTISNGLTIGKEWDLASADLINYSISQGWSKSTEDFHFARCYSEPVYTYLSDCRARCKRSTSLLDAKSGDILTSDLMRVLRDHDSENIDEWRPDRGITGANVCMHAGFGPVRASQTVGSMVSRLDPGYPIHFFTATSAPCTSIFKPVWLDAGIPDIGSVPNGTYDLNSLFWQHERLHRQTLTNYPENIKLFMNDRDNLEDGFISQALSAADKPAADRLALSNQCFQEAKLAELDWLERVRKNSHSKRNRMLYSLAWSSFNRSGKMRNL